MCSSVYVGCGLVRLKLTQEAELHLHDFGSACDPNPVTNGDADAKALALARLFVCNLVVGDSVDAYLRPNHTVLSDPDVGYGSIADDAIPVDEGGRCYVQPDAVVDPEGALDERGGRPDPDVAVGNLGRLHL